MRTTRVLLICVMMLLGSCAGLLVDRNARDAFEKGLSMFNAGSYEAAAEQFKRAAELDPEFGRAYLYLGRSYLNLGNWSGALTPLRTAYRLAPDETRKEIFNILIDALVSAAADALKRGDFQTAMVNLREGFSMSPQSEHLKAELVKALVGYGMESLNSGNFQGAVSALSEAVQLSPDNLRAYLGLAEAFFNSGDMLRAFQAAQKAITLQPSNPDAQDLFLRFDTQQ